MKNCDSYCEHGGVCEKEHGHTGNHDSGYCNWTDATAVPKNIADNIYEQKAKAIGISPEVIEITKQNT